MALRLAACSSAIGRESVAGGLRGRGVTQKQLDRGPHARSLESRAPISSHHRHRAHHRGPRRRPRRRAHARLGGAALEPLRAVPAGTRPRTSWRSSSGTSRTPRSSDAAQRDREPRGRAGRDLADRFSEAPQVDEGAGIGRIEIPAIGRRARRSSRARTPASLRKGPGHYAPAGRPGGAQSRVTAQRSPAREDGRNRGPPHDLRRAVQPHRRARARRRDHARDALRDLHVRGRERSRSSIRTRSASSGTSATSGSC